MSKRRGSKDSKRRGLSLRTRIRRLLTRKPRLAGAVVYRTSKRGREYLLVTARRGHTWVLPKGKIERGETAREAALRELREEAGIVGKAVASLGDVLLLKRLVPTTARFFLVRRRDKVPSDEDRRLRWCTPKRARSKLHSRGARTAITRAEQYFAKR